jgi:hypothetical protein
MRWVDETNVGKIARMCLQATAGPNLSLTKRSGSCRVWHQEWIKILGLSWALAWEGMFDVKPSALLFV